MVCPTEADEAAAGLRSLKALARGAGGLGAGGLALLLVTGSPLAASLVPIGLSVAAIGLGLGVFLVDPHPRFRWRGMGILAVLLGVYGLAVHLGLA